MHIVINNRNRLTYPMLLIGQLVARGEFNIHIIDNGSTYPPLLKWYDTVQDTITIHKHQNLGHLAIYNSGLINNFKNDEWVAYTDSDIVLPSTLPNNFLEEMVKIANLLSYDKVGLALRIDDLPDTPYGNASKTHEAQFWKEEVLTNVYKAHVDTTFCIIKPSKRFDYEALRIAGPYTSIHAPWYQNFSYLSEEEQYYLDHCNSSSTYRKYYDTFKDK